MSRRPAFFLGAVLLAALPFPFSPPQPAPGLAEVLQSRGYDFRQHLEEVGWTRRKLTVVDLDDRQRRALLDEGLPGLRRVLDEQGLWSFPALDIERLRPVETALLLAQDNQPQALVVSPKTGPLRRLAEQTVAQIESRFGVRLPWLEDSQAELAELDSRHVLLFGGSHESRFAMDLALRYPGGFVDATIPGPDGWVVTTHAGLNASGRNVLQVTAPPQAGPKVLQILGNALFSQDGKLLLRRTHQIEPGPDMRAHFPSWEAWTARLMGGSAGAPAVSLTPSQVADRLAPGLDSGGPEVNRYNAAPIDNTVQAAQYYLRSADPRALQLFRELLFRLADYYLKTPQGASYPADLDFRIGHVILYYSRLEHEPVFSLEDRLILANLLLSCARSMHEYVTRLWPIRADEPTRHNHETFPARSLVWAADYFERYGVPYVQEWRQYVSEVFSGQIWTRFKQRENANSYETYAFEHGAGYSAFTGRRLDLFERESLRLAALRHLITVDNFLRPVDYGDFGPTLLPGHADKLPALFVSQFEDPLLGWFASACFARQRNFLPAPLDGFTGIRRRHEGPPPPARGWELLPLDPRFAATQAPGFPLEHAFDKLAFRTGWQDQDQYLLFEGVGNQKVSHSHNAVNSIVRLNHLGRHWLVSNGYGRRVGISNVANSFSTRVRGPEDHNMLVLRRAGEIVRDLPMCTALLQRGQSGELAYVTGALLDYGGLDWFRTLLVLADRLVVVLDRIRIVEPGLEAAHIEWNGLGELSPQPGGYRFHQQQVFLDLTSDSGWKTGQGVSDQSAEWKNLLESGSYPFAGWPIKKLKFHLPELGSGSTSTLAVLLAATPSSRPAYSISQPQPGLLRLQSMVGNTLPQLYHRDGDLSIQGGGAQLEVRFDPVPNLPSALKNQSADR